jgi:hypothetical protein
MKSTRIGALMPVRQGNGRKEGNIHKSRMTMVALEKILSHTTFTRYVSGKGGISLSG